VRPPDAGPAHRDRVRAEWHAGRSDSCLRWIPSRRSNAEHWIADT
jgi:hypothetical protein